MQAILDRFNKERPLEQRLEEFYNLLNRGQNSRQRSAEVGERRGAGAGPSLLHFNTYLKERTISTYYILIINSYKSYNLPKF